jgi:chemotaxis protein CheD
MNIENDKIDIFLQPGDFYFGDRETRISTLLGSCVAITLWHPKRLIGGMCHYMLPTPQFRKDLLQLNGKYAEDAMTMFLQEIKAAGTSPSEYQTKIFGGGHMFSKTINPPHCSLSYSNCIDSYSCKNIACKNALIAPYLLQKQGFSINNHDLGGTQHRKVIFELWSGDVWLRKGK